MGQLMGAPPLIALLLGAGPIKVAAWRTESDRALSPPVTSQPVTSHPVTGQLISVHPVTGHPVASQPVTSQPVTSQPGTSQLGSSQPGIGLQSFAYDLQTQIPPGYIPINVPVQSYAPSISSHISHGSVHRLSCRPRWLSWMRRPTGDQEVAGSTPAEVGNILSWRLIMKYFLRSSSPFR